MEIATFISNVGFPIACCVYMGVYLQHNIQLLQIAVENNTEVIKDLREQLKEMQELKGGENK